MGFENRTTPWVEEVEQSTRARMPAGRITQEQFTEKFIQCRNRVKRRLLEMPQGRFVGVRCGLPQPSCFGKANVGYKEKMDQVFELWFFTKCLEELWGLVIKYNLKKNLGLIIVFHRLHYHNSKT